MPVQTIIIYAMKKLFFLFLLFSLTFPASFAQSWFELGTGSQALNANKDVGSICSDSHGNIYAAGGFTDSAGYLYVSKWDGHNWSKLGSGDNPLEYIRNISMPNSIKSICVDDSNNIYAVGDFNDTSTEGSFVAKWNGASWIKLGAHSNKIGTGFGVNAMCVDKFYNVYVAPYDVDAYGYYYIKKWDGAHWTELGITYATYSINAICTDDTGNVYVAGSFTDDSGYFCVLKWNGATWNQLGGSFSSVGTGTECFTICSDKQNNIYTAVGSAATPANVFKWDGSAWSQLGVGGAGLNANSEDVKICVDSNLNVYAGGDFTDGSGNNYVAKWDGVLHSWSQLGTNFGTAGLIGAIYADGSEYVYTGGFFVDDNNKRYVSRFGPPLSVESIKGDDIEIKVYPNPTNDELSISGIQQQTTYRLLSITGVSLQSGLLMPGSNSLTMKNYSPGIYVLELTDLKGVKTVVRVVKD